MTTRYVRLYLGADNTGQLAPLDGWHCLVIFDQGPKLITALHPPTLTLRRVPLDPYTSAADVPLSPWRWRRLAERIARRHRCLARGDEGRKALKRRRETGVAAQIRRAAELCRRMGGPEQ